MTIRVVTMVMLLFCSYEGGVDALRLPTRLTTYYRHRGVASSSDIVSVSPLTRMDMTVDEGPDREEDKVILGLQAKYFYAVCVLLFAFAYDFFVTHNSFKDGWVP